MTVFFRLSRLAVGVLTLMLAFVTTSQAGQKAPPPPPPIDHRILVAAVDVPKQQITIIYEHDKSKHTYTVDDMTAVKANGHDGSSVKDIKAGDQVYSYIERDDIALSSIEVSVAQPGPIVPKKK